MRWCRINNLPAHGKPMKVELIPQREIQMSNYNWAAYKKQDE